VKSSLALLTSVVIVLVTCLPRGLDADSLGSLEVKMRCHPPVLYRGGSLVVEFDSPHDNFDFAIQARYGLAPVVAHPKADKLFLLTFEPGKNDRIPPVISPREFASMNQITLNTVTARGSAGTVWQGEEIPRALKPPESIFTESGTYQILLSRALGAEDAFFGACYVDYVDEEREAGTFLPKEVLSTVMNSTFSQLGCRATEAWGGSGSPITCPTTPLYKGEPLVLLLLSGRPARRIGIVDPDWNFFLLPAEKNPTEHGHPGVRTIAGSESAKASSYESAPSSGSRPKHVQTKGGRVFTKSGWYIAMPVPGPRCDEPTDLDACWIHYIDAPPPNQTPTAK